MPNITLECTSNVTLDYKLFFEELCDRLVATGHAPKLGMKCRAISSDDHYIIDGKPGYKMVNLLIRLREGRSKKVLKEFSQIGMDLLQEHLKEDVDNHAVILSTEIKELIKGQDLTFNSIRKGMEKNN
ncbi:MAG: 5-carboxymethyl-2-hydroxymuconate Delta-isomerase [Bacteroidia bacterium]|nr:5-carboxymethyl-2-hydroxymuconate Delta-isomerase [Bacteroidia bacterium]MBT8229266.1 5-carboxymethyl-2-hydroxymuconate Delta-isomerase [Bacteroidia bacterium]